MDYEYQVPVCIPGLTTEMVEESVDVFFSNFKKSVPAFHKALDESQEASQYMARERRVLGPPSVVRDLRDRIVQLIAPHSACRQGCSHCCKMAVTITSNEAAEIGKAIGVTPRQPRAVLNQDETVSKYLNVPCVFLKKGECSIYEYRPTACRTHFNISAFPQLCDTVNYPGHDVPSLDMSPLWRALSFDAFLCGSYPADIRDFFPNGMHREESL